MSTFWIYDIKQLFSYNCLQDTEFENYDFPRKLNCLSQLIIVIWFFLFLSKYKYSSEFLIIFLSFIIINYYINTQKKMYRENYIPQSPPSTCYSTDLSITGPGISNVTYFDKDIYAIQLNTDPYTKNNTYSGNYASTIPLKDWDKIPKQQDLRIQTLGQDRLYNDELPSYFDGDFYSTNFA